MTSKKNQHIFLSAGLVIAAIVLIIILAVFSKEAINQKNGFSRRFFRYHVSLEHYLSINDSIRSLCGIGGNHIYFDTPTPGYIFQSDSNLANVHFINLFLKKDDRLQSLFTTFIDSPFVYIMAGNVPAIIVINLTSKARLLYQPGKILFTHSAVINKKAFVLRGYKKINGKWEQIFYKINTATNLITEEENISARTGDGGFSTDGLLHYDKATSYLVFVNYYSNDFICLDSSLHLVYKSRTIDTVSTYQAKANTSRTDSYVKITNISPIRDVNLHSCTDSGNLFINSALVANNESRKSFINNSVIDVYHLETGVYKGSFYIPLFKGERLKEFSVNGSRIIVLYHTYAAIYTMPISR